MKETRYLSTLVLLVGLLGFSANTAKGKGWTSPTPSLKGNIKHCVERTYRIWSDKRRGQEGQLLESVQEYSWDNRQNLVEKKSYGSYSLQGGRETFTYDEKNRETTHTKYSPTGRLLFHWVSFYNPEGLLIRQEDQASGEPPYKNISHKYDDHGRIIKRSYAHPSDGILHEEEYSYNQKGYQSRLTYYPKTLEERIGNEQRFDQKGRVTYEKIYTIFGEEHTKRYYTYDSLGRLIKDEERYLDGSLVHLIKYLYNQHDDVVEITHWNQENKMIRSQKFVYTYDDHGNWIQKMEEKKGFNNYIILRQIQYYDSPSIQGTSI